MDYPKTVFVFLIWLLGWGSSGAAEPVIAESWSVSFADGRSLVKTQTDNRTHFVDEGMHLQAGDTVTVAAGAMIEVRLDDSHNEGLWRIGSGSVWMLREDGAALLVGAGLVEIPDKQRVKVTSSRGEVELPEGIWLLQAVNNEGLKIIALSRKGELHTRLADETHASRVLQPGELTFVQPDDKGFGPVVTVYLMELVKTSRLLNGFPQPLAGQKRLQAVASAQAERLQGVTNAFVGGARDENGFQLVVPRSGASR